ncbi:MAG: hypothetical protein WD688_10435 [Candidatus Binatia bacterium]
MEADQLHLPAPVEAMRLVPGYYMEASGLNQDELNTVCTENPAKVVRLELN